MNNDIGYSLCIIITSTLIYLFYKCILKREKINWEDLYFSKKRKNSQLIKGFL